MSGDPEVDVILAVANHPTADRALLTKLAFEAEEGAVRSTAQRRLRALVEEGNQGGHPGALELRLTGFPE